MKTIIIVDPVGFVLGESSITEFRFAVNPKNVPKFGEYVLAENRDEKEVLGIVRNVTNFNRLLEETFGFDYAIKNINISKKVLERNEIVIASAKTLGVIEDGKIIPNRVPIKPNSTVKLADEEILHKIFKNSVGVELGNLVAREKIKVALDLNQLILRHFAILSVTGGGKSNVVCLIANEIVRKFGGSVILIDPHGEYAGFVFEDGKENGKNVIPAGIRPERLEPWEFCSLVGVDKDASVQRMHLERIFTTVKREKLSGREFMWRVLEIAEDWIGTQGEIEYVDSTGAVRTARISREDLNPLYRVKEYVATFMRRYEDLLTQRDMLANLKESSLNIVNLSGFDEEQMRVVVAYLLRNILIGRISYVRNKNREFWSNACPIIKKPLLMIFEEAHIFATKGDVALWMSRIAREGRKFGIGIGIVSQRPKRISEDILSQCNTKIVLRIVEPNDQRYVQQASEQISEDLLSDIASLGVGEAVIVGPAIKIPAAVKIRRFQGHYGGRDLDVLSEWKSKISEGSLEDLL
ncbi:MAG: ATP-binding protein [Archaeoglobales archaeon]|nr:ATP-binding protein [Archaeoglobales archaeon]